MIPPHTRKGLRHKRRALRKRLAVQTTRLRTRLGEVPAVKRQRAKRGRRVRQWGLLSLLILLLCFGRCNCEPEGAPALPDTTVPTPTPAPQQQTSKTRRPSPIKGRGQQAPRPPFVAASSTAPLWIDAFRLQVAARSPRLAACVSGSAQPGTLRWTTAVNTDSGAVSEHALELVGASTSLDEQQQLCMLGVLSSPAYKLAESSDHQGGSEPTTPKRVSLVIEF